MSRTALRTRRNHSVRPAIRMWMDGEVLCYKEVLYREDFVSDADEAVALLREGKEIWLQQYATLCNRVQRVVEGRAT